MVLSKEMCKSSFYTEKKSLFLDNVTVTDEFRSQLRIDIVIGGDYISDQQANTYGQIFL